MYHRVKAGASGHQRAGPYSCSFIEFDHAGDSLDSNQIRDCLRRIRELPGGKTPLVFIYCHGWHHNSQSGDVRKFRSMLSHFASLDSANYAVHGVYLAWPASTFSVPGQGNLKDTAEPTATGLGGAIEGVWPLNYWAKKSLASNRIGPSPRFQDTISQICRTTRGRSVGRRGSVVATGHSFGALVLERAIASDMLRDFTSTSASNALPDLLFFFNSAAHATDAFQSVSAMTAAGTPGSRPRVVSVTTRRDAATKGAHFVGNAFAGFSQWNQRWYGGKYPQSSALFRGRGSAGLEGWTIDPDKLHLIFESGPDEKHWFWRESVHASELRRRTPGHTDMLISHGFSLVKEEPVVDNAGAPESFSSAALFNLTAEPEKERGSSLEDPVLTCMLPTNQGNRTWNLHPLYPKKDPRLKDKYVNQTPYWVIPLPDAILSDPSKGFQNHNDVWTQGHFNLIGAFMKQAGIIDPQRVKAKGDEIERSIKEDTIQRQSTEVPPAEEEDAPVAG